MGWQFWKKPIKSDVSVTAEPKKEESGAVVVAPKEEPETEAPEYDPIPPMDLMKVKWTPSPNKSARRGDVKYIVLHHTGPGSYSGIVKWLCNPAAKASAHYVVSKGGQVSQLVNTGKESWHAGRARYQGKRIDNHHSIGIEICNYGVLEKGDDGHYYYEQGRQLKRYTGKTEPVPASITYPSGKVLEGYAVPYPEKQVEKVIALCKGLIEKYPQIGPSDILTHFEIGDPEGRKNDPFGLDIEMVISRIFS